MIRSRLTLSDIISCSHALLLQLPPLLLVVLVLATENTAQCNYCSCVCVAVTAIKRSRRERTNDVVSRYTKPKPHLLRFVENLLHNACSKVIYHKLYGKSTTNCDLRQVCIYQVAKAYNSIQVIFASRCCTTCCTVRLVAAQVQNKPKYSGIWPRLVLVQCSNSKSARYSSRHLLLAEIRRQGQQ